MVRTRSQRQNDADNQNNLRVNDMPYYDPPVIDIDEFYIPLTPDQVREHGYTEANLANLENLPEAVREHLEHLPPASTVVAIDRIAPRPDGGAVLLIQVTQFAGPVANQVVPICIIDQYPTDSD